MVAVAKEFERDGRRVVQPKISQWDLKLRERKLFKSAESIPNWRLAEKTRRLLADTASHMSAEIPSQVGLAADEFDSAVARQFAGVATAGIAVRASSSALMLVACGYSIEAAGPLRRLIEAKLHARAVCDDDSGEYALRLVKGRGMGMSKLAQRYGEREEIDALSTIAHADTAALRLYEREGSLKGRGAPVQEAEFSVLPEPDIKRASSVLYVIAYETAGMAVVVAEIFGVALEIPSWIGAELKRLSEREG